MSEKFRLIRNADIDDTPVERTAEERAALLIAKNAFEHSIEKVGGIADLPGIEDASWKIEELDI